VELWEGVVEAVRMVARADPYLRDVALRTLLVSGSATLLAMAVGVPLGYLPARARFPGRTVVLTAVHTGMGLPPVIAGLVIFLLFVRSGPFGGLGLIYTPQAMVIAQFVIALPMVVGFTAAAVASLPVEFSELLAMLGAGPLRTMWLTVREARLGLLAAVMAGFGAVISEVGASMTVGGNLAGSTRVLTTAIVLEASRGEHARAIALGVILLALALAVNFILTSFQQRRGA